MSAARPIGTKQRTPARDTFRASATARVGIRGLTMPWSLTLAAGFALGLLVAGAVRVLGDYLTRRPVARPVALRPTPVELPTPRSYGAADILGYHDLGGRWHAPTHPRTAGATTSAAALAAWESRHERAAA